MSPTLHYKCLQPQTTSRYTVHNLHHAFDLIIMENSEDY